MGKANKKGPRFLGIAVAIFGLLLVFGIGSNMMDGYKLAKLTGQLKPACVGRFLIDLPEQMDFSYSHTLIRGYWVAAFTEDNEAFLARVAAREAEINSGPNEHGEQNMEKVEEVSNHGFSGKIFTFGRWSVNGLKNRKPVTYTNVAVEAYVHSSQTTFTFKAEGVAPDRVATLGKIIERLRVVAPNIIPSAPGFCFGPGMLIDPVPADWTEGVVLFAGFRDHPDLALAFDTRAGLKPDNSGSLLERDSRVDAEMPLWQRPLLKKIRKGKRTINGIKGEEVLERGTELNFVNVYAFDWEVDGTQDDVLVPAMHLEMSTGHPIHAGARPVRSFLNEEALVQLWDRISSSIRVRPTSPVVPVDQVAGPSGPKLGDAASAGEICPETGWWQCHEGGNGTGVLGGQRQFLRKGQRMPQALLLPQQTLWEKVRGVQSSYESKQATAWTLIDRRSTARVQPDISLAPAIAQNGSAGAYGADSSETAAKVGSFVRTGSPCPASGWWRCQDSEALDGTRWFAKGELLPAATFRLAKPQFLIRTGDVEAYQRRSTWQLVRQATDPTS